LLTRCHCCHCCDFARVATEQRPSLSLPCVTMKAILQRVLSASVTVEGDLVSSIGKGVLVLAAVGPADSRKDADSLASKVVKMRLWPDDGDSQWKQSVQDIRGEVLCVSQFTLLANTKKGSKPDFHGAAKPDFARELYDYFVSRVAELHGKDSVKDGVFQAMMQVALVNDGPVRSAATTRLISGECSSY
jgi:D-aminoacyl-tRNA deacylase